MATSGKPRYIFIAPWPITPGTGVNEVILNLRETMKPAYDATIAVPSGRPAPPDQVPLKLPGLGYSWRSNLGFIALLPLTLFRLRSFVRGAIAVNPHFPDLEIFAFALLRRMRLGPKLILSVHGNDVTGALASAGVKRLLYRWLYASADVVIACSGALASKVRTLSPRARAAAVWNGVTHPGPVSEQRPLAAPYLVCVAGFVPKKAHQVLLSAYRQVLAARPDLHLVLIGNPGPENAPVAAALEAWGLEDKTEVLINLPHDQVWRWVKHAACFVLPSRDEPFGIAILEAALMRTPVVATRVGGIPEFLEDGVHGLLCEPDRPDELAAQILATLADPAAARDRAATFYERAASLTWERAFAGYRSKAALP